MGELIKSGDENFEKLASVQHDIWSHWMRWMFTTGAWNNDGTWTMPAEKLERWGRQMNMSYSALSEAEKDSDREQATKIVEALQIRHADSGVE